MRLCINCIYCRQSISYHVSELGGWESIDYGNEKCQLSDVVYGDGSGGQLCSFERSASGKCGPDAGLFEAKPPKPPRPPRPPQNRICQTTVFGERWFQTEDDFNRWKALPWWRRLFA